METNSGSQNDTKQGDKDPLPFTEAAPKAFEVPIVEVPATASKRGEIAGDFEQKPGDCQGPTSKRPPYVNTVGGRELSHFERRTILLGWLGLGIGFFSLLAACIAGFLVYHQWWEMNAQTGYLNKAAEQARRDSAESSAVTSKQLGIAQDQARAAQDSAKTIQEQMQIDERAWVQIRQHESTVFVEIKLVDGSPILVPIQFMNTGKTPAKDVDGMIAVSIYKKNAVLKFRYGHGYPAYHVNFPIIFAGYASAPYSYAVQPITGPTGGKYSPVILTPSLHQSINTGDSILVVHGRITYRDIFGIKRGTTFCMTNFPLGDLSDPYMNACPDYNNVY